MLPDQDPELIAIKDQNKRCERCMIKYPGVIDAVCEACKFNPMKTRQGRDSFIDHLTSKWKI